MEYVILPVRSPLKDCDASLRGGYNSCPNSSLLLDSEHGPSTYSQAALNRFYLQLINGKRTLFKFDSEVHIEVVQIYYYAAVLTDGLSVIRLTFYSVDSDRYSPRMQIPGNTMQLNFTDTFDMSGHFGSLCFTLGASVKNLLVASTVVGTEFHVSEMNFYTSPVSEEVCKGEYSPFPTKGEENKIIRWNL